MQTVFRANYSIYEGEPPRLYRSCDAIRRDIKEIKREISSTMEGLNIRNILTEVIAKYAEEDPEEWVPHLVELCEEADATLNALVTLRDTLSELKAELEETKWLLER